MKNKILNNFVIMIEGKVNDVVTINDKNYRIVEKMVTV
nr:MAG TPA: ATP-binding sugar transporter [Crassvirales sp.]